MAKSPDSRKAKDPARPTRAKAAREPLAPIAPALEKLLNPGIAKGTAGVGSQTGLQAACGQLMGSPCGFFRRAYGAEVDAEACAGLSAPLPLAGRGRGWGSGAEAPREHLDPPP